MKKTHADIVTEKQCLEAGMIISIILVIAGLWTVNKVFYVSSLTVLFLGILVPSIFRPFAVFWFGLSGKMGIISSWIILSIIFYLVVTPVALVNKLRGKDSLNLKAFKKDKATVFRNRQHKFDGSDLHHVY